MKACGKSQLSLGLVRLGSLEYINNLVYLHHSLPFKTTTRMSYNISRQGYLRGFEAREHPRRPVALRLKSAANHNFSFIEHHTHVKGLMTMCIITCAKERLLVSGTPLTKSKPNRFEVGRVGRRHRIQLYNGWKQSGMRCFYLHNCLIWLGYKHW